MPPTGCASPEVTFSPCAFLKTGETGMPMESGLSDVVVATLHLAGLQKRVATSYACLAQSLMPFPVS